jgi:hypothetical protein
MKTFIGGYGSFSSLQGIPLRYIVEVVMRFFEKGEELRGRLLI